MKYFDSHAHYYDERFNEETGEGADALIGTLLEGNVSYIVNVGTSPETSRLAAKQAKSFDRVYTALGIHPSDCQYLKRSMAEELADIESLILDRANKCVAIGEIGLDYHWPDTDKEKQLAYFEAQMQMAERLSLPVVIHDRDAHGDVLDVIRKYPNVRGVLHSFSGSPETARELAERGYMISFSGTLTFKNARRPKESVRAVPPESLLIETDCPYLAPHPERGTLNHSGKLVYTNAMMAELLGITDGECASLTEKNAKRFFNIND